MGKKGQLKCCLKIRITKDRDHEEGGGGEGEREVRAVHEVNHGLESSTFTPHHRKHLPSQIMK